MSTPESTGPPRFAALAEPRHQCFACGHCCTGHWVEVDEAEREAIERHGVALGVEQPVVEGGLRFADGACVFLGEDRLCGIHKEFGIEAKPVVCQQYPFVAIDIGGTFRVGIDPGCTNAWKTWKEGPRHVPDRFLPKPRRLHPSQEAPERALVAALGEPDMTVPGMLHLLCTGAPGGPDLPEGLAGRWIERLQSIDLASVLADPTNGWGMRTVLGRLPAAIDSWDPTAPPPLRLGVDQQGWALEVTRRMLYLRLAILIPAVQGTALLSLLGAVAVGWLDPTPERFGATFGGWSRVMRLRAVWRALVPDPETMAWLATGQRPF